MALQCQKGDQKELEMRFILNQSEEGKVCYPYLFSLENKDRFYKKNRLFRNTSGYLEYFFFQLKKVLLTSIVKFYLL